MSPRPGYIVAHQPALTPGTRWGGCRRVFATPAEAEAHAGDRLGRTRWVYEVFGLDPPALGGGPRDAAVGWTDTRHLIAARHTP